MYLFGSLEKEFKMWKSIQNKKER